MSLSRLILTDLALATGLFSLLFSLTALAGARSFTRARRKSARPADAAFPAVTIMKPLKGQDHELYENLASFCGQDYPTLQILFCVASPDDAAVEVVERLRRNFPRVDMELVVSRRQIGCNPKISNLANAASRIKHEAILISDSDIRVRPDFLRRMTETLSDPRVGMASCFYRAVKPKGLWSVLEALAINAQFLPQALTAGAFGMRFAMGAAMILRREAFEKAGGFAALADHIADDHILGEAVMAAGWKLEFSDTVVDSVTETWGAEELLRHQIREARTIRICRPGGYAGMALLHGFSWLTLALAAYGADARLLELAAALWLVKAASTLLIFRTLGKSQNPWGLLLLPLSDWLAFAAWLSAFGSNQVLWRGVMYSIEPNGRLIPSNRALQAAPAEN